MRIAHVQQALLAAGHVCVPLNLGPDRKTSSPEYEAVKSGWDYVRKVRRYCQQGFLVHMHVNGESLKGFVLTFIALGLSWWYGKRAVLTYHGGPDQIYVSRETSLRVKMMLRLLFRLPQRIICNNEGVKNRIIAFGALDAHVIPIPAFSVQYLDGEAPLLDATLQHFVESHHPLLFTYVMYRDEFHVPSVVQAAMQLAQRWPHLGLIVTGAGENTDDIRQLLHVTAAEAHVFHAGDVSHEAFLHLLRRSKLYLRSHERDGVCSSVLEALALGIPVVASADGTRPPSVITFAIGDWRDITEKVQTVLDQYEVIQSNLIRPALRDTVQDEVSLLVACSNLP